MLTEDINLDNIFNNLLTDEQPAPPMEAVQPKALNTKAMSVQLVTRKPTTRFNDEEAAKAARSALGDDGIGGYTTLFKDNTNPIRHLLNEQSSIYVFHKKNTLPYIDRGPRLLPVTSYETYRDTMRTLIRDAHNKLAAIMPNYDQYVANDIAYRNATATAMGRVGRASPSDYPSAQDFKAAFDLQFTFTPLPDNSHWLFDIDAEDRAKLADSTNAIYKAAMADLRQRLEKPLQELVDALHTRTVEDENGKKYGVDTRTGLPVKGTGIFRDTKVTNVTEALVNVRALSLGDEDVLAVCDSIQACLPKEVTTNIDVLRESPVVREAAAKKLAEVASKMGAFFGG